MTHSEQSRPQVHNLMFQSDGSLYVQEQDGSHWYCTDEDDIEDLIRNKYPTNEWYRTNWELPEALPEARKLCEAVTEALHQNLDGWSRVERLTILKFLADVQSADKFN